MTVLETILREGVGGLDERARVDFNRAYDGWATLSTSRAAPSATDDKDAKLSNAKRGMQAIPQIPHEREELVHKIRPEVGALTHPSE
jgi:hypothetical protein